MIEEMSLEELLTKLAICSGDEAIDLVTQFQSGGLLIEGMGVEDFDV